MTSDDLTPERAFDIWAAGPTVAERGAVVYTILAAWEADRARLATLEADAECEIDALLGEARMGATECEYQLELAESRLATVTAWVDALVPLASRTEHQLKAEPLLHRITAYQLSAGLSALDAIRAERATTGGTDESRAV
jgi:acyl-CoA reductase-like NAD-dependent aldehyde dehydrogenase